MNDSAVQDFIISLDDFDPGERLDKLNLLAGANEAKRLQRDEWLFLIALYVIDETIREKLPSRYFFYIFGDATVFRLLAMSGFPHIEGRHGHKLAVLLGAAHLLYRFNAAKKFTLPDEKTKQLRLNSWARAYIQERGILEAMSAEVEKIRSVFWACFEENEESYKRLCQHLLSDITRETAQEILDLNEKLQIKLLS
ncbi:MAG: hypothetical protein AB7S81_02595 [Bdellovibrionales bacterium]